MAKEKKQLKSFLEVLIPKLLQRDYTIMTREGEPSENGRNVYCLDNLVLDIACNYRDEHKLDYDTVISLQMDNNKRSIHDRKIIQLKKSERFSAYKEIINNCDVIIGIGGTGGVYRLGLVSAATNHFFIPLSIVEGTSCTLARELNDYLSDNYSPDLSAYTMDNHIDGKEIDYLISAITNCLNKPNSNTKTELSSQQLFDLLQSNTDKLKEFSFKQLWQLLTSLPISWLLPLFVLLLTVIVLFIVQLALNVI